MRIYYGCVDARGLPCVRVWREGELSELLPSQHARCPEPGHGWGEEVQALNTAWTVLRDALPGAYGYAALRLTPRFRAEVVSRWRGREWRMTKDEVLTWVVRVALEYGYPELSPVPFKEEEGEFEPLP